MTAFLQIEGSAIVDIPSLYAEINRVFMAGEDWQLGPSLDALDDLLYGGHGALAGHETATVVWRDIDRSREALGSEATRAWLEDKLRQPGRFNAETIGRQLDALQRGEGQTYFQIVMDIFASHRTLHWCAPEVAARPLVWGHACGTRQPFQRHRLRK
jgi:hypothetical protein